MNCCLSDAETETQTALSLIRGEVDSLSGQPTAMSAGVVAITYLCRQNRRKWHRPFLYRQTMQGWHEPQQKNKENLSETAVS